MEKQRHKHKEGEKIEMRQSSQRGRTRTKPAVLNLWIMTIGKHIGLMVLGTETLLSSKITVTGGNKNKLWLGVSKSIRNRCFPMVVTHKLRITALNNTERQAEGQRIKSIET